MNYLKLCLIALTTLLFIGCSDGDTATDDITSEITTSINGDYTIDTTKNNALMGPLKGASVYIYALNDLNTSLEETTTDNYGAFSLSLEGIDDETLLVVRISGGEDIDINDDAFLDTNATRNYGTIRTIATCADLRSGNVNVTLISEIAYRYVQHLVGTTHPDDLEVALNEISNKLFKEAISRSASYRDINSFIPIDTASIDALDFNYTQLVKEGSFAQNLREDLNTTQIEDKLNEYFGQKLSFRDSRLSENTQYIRLRLLQPIESNISSQGSNLFCTTDTNESQLQDFVLKGSDVNITIALGDNVKIMNWRGCDEVSDDLSICRIRNISKDTQITPAVIYKEVNYDATVKDVSEYLVTINDTNYTISLDFDANETQKSFIADIQPNDIIISANDTNRFFKKILSNEKVDDYNYRFVVENVSFLEMYQQGGVFLDKELTYADLEDENLTAVSRAFFPAGNVTLLPPKSLDESEFVIQFGDTNSRAIEDSAGGEVEIAPGLKVSGTLSYKIDTEFNYNIDWFTLKTLHYVVTKEIKSELKITQSVDILAISDKIQLGNRINYRVPIPGAPLWMNVSIAFYIGYEGKIEAVATISGEYSSVSKNGFDYVDGTISVIDTASNTGKTGIVGEFKASAGAYFMMTPAVTIVDVAGAGIDTKAGIYIENAVVNDILNEECSLAKGKIYGKLSAELRFLWAPWLNENFEWARDIASRINRAIEDGGLKLELAKSYTIKEWNGQCEEQMPAYLSLDAESISLEKFSDDSLYETYTFSVQNTGEASLQWEAKVDPEFAEFVYLSPELGTLSKDDSIDILVVADKDDLSTLNGTQNGYIQFTNLSEAGSDAEVGNYRVDISLTVHPRLSAPSLESVTLNGESIKKINFEWSFDGENIDGFKIYKSLCSEENYFLFSERSFIEGLSYAINYADYENTTNNAKELLAGERYCFKITSYKETLESEPSNILTLDIPAYATLISSIKDRNDNPMSNASVYLTTLANSAVSDGSGDYTFENLMPGRYLITVEADGYSPTTAEITLEAGQTLIYEGQYVLEENLTGLESNITGYVKSAINNSVTIEGVLIEIRDGAGNIDGDILAQVMSDAQGGLNIILESGTYTFAWSKEGYISDATTVVVVGGEDKYLDLSISEILIAGTIRTTLRWGETPRDLDSHMVKKTDGVENYHIYYGVKTAGDDSLDTDDTSSYGPETITINSIDTNAIFTYYVYNFTHSAPEELRNSGANITVQTENASQTLYIPNEDGYYWKVYEIVNGEVIPCTSGCVSSDTITTRSLREETALFSNLPAK